MKHLLSIGEMVIDFLPGEEAGSYIRKAGGAPANVAIAYSRQGCSASFCGMMGDDDFGHFLYDTLVQNGVEPALHELTAKAVTTMAFLTLSEDGERSFTFARKPGADMFLNKKHITDELIASADIVHAGSCSLSAGDAAEATVYAMQKASLADKLVSFDLNYRNLMWNDDVSAASIAISSVLPFVDMLKISDEECSLLGGESELTNIMERNNIALLIETLGSNGARYFWQGKSGVCKALKAECVVDTCGAGDAFWGSFLACLSKADVSHVEDLSEEIIMRALQCGNIAGSLCVQRKGAIESLPTSDEVQTLWSKMYI